MISLRARFAKPPKTANRRSQQKSHQRSAKRRSHSITEALGRVCDHTSRYVGVALISGYQKFISPHKGFRCAHRVLYGGESCSTYIKRIAAEEGVIRALRSLKPRFAECRCAYETIKVQAIKTQAIETQRQQAQGLQISQAYTTGRVDLVSHSAPSASTPSASAPSASAPGTGWAMAEEPENDTGTNSPDSNPPEEPDSDQIPLQTPVTEAKKSAESSATETSCVDCGDLAGCASDSCAGSNCDAIGSTLSESCSAINCDGLDCAAFDCGALDCGALDCGALDCGSCG